MDVYSNRACVHGGAHNLPVDGDYGPTAYRPDSIPSQQDQRGDANRSTLGRAGSIRLPWGNAQDVVLASILSVIPLTYNATEHATPDFSEEGRPFWYDDKVSLHDQPDPA